jgi:hypothetical protein
MAIESSRLDSLYTSYGFKKKKSSSGDVRVYTYRGGYFNNADIIPISAGADTSTDLKNYQSSGYACTIRDYQSLQDAENKLFEGFFSLDGTKSRFNDEDDKFRTKQANNIGADYRFIDPPYLNAYESNTSHLDVSLIDSIMADLKSSGPRLIILEAAAGYGKTCASFELLRRSLDCFSGRLPLFIELSRNRQAKIFRYVLLDEIDRFFPTLSISLVQTQIGNGKLFLIVDGFDELLHRRENANPDYDKVEPMLETLSDLLIGDAKIVLTSRKTAIFNGDHFHTWMHSHENDFNISRYSLLKPKLENWLSYERRSALERISFPIEKISNPVLLAFLSAQEQDRFDNLMNNPDNIVRYYFDRLLDREKERQELLMDVDEQYRLFTRLAGHMLEMDFTSEDHEYLQYFLMENNGALLASVRNRYTSETRPTIEELTAKLVSHALLDRKGEDGVSVGFVNDFALGNFVAEHLLQASSDELIVGEDFLEQAVISFLPRSKKRKELLWNKLIFTLEFLSSEQRVLSEIMLCGGPQHNLKAEAFNGVIFEDTYIGEQVMVTECVFVDCTFKKTKFILNNLKDITFVGCRFYECEYVNTEPCRIENIFLVGCSGETEVLEQILEDLSTEEEIGSQNDFDMFKRSVLEQYWPVGRPHFWSKRQLITLYRGHANNERTLVSRAITELRHDGLLVIKGDTAEINTAELQRIREILGR